MKLVAEVSGIFMGLLGCYNTILSEKKLQSKGGELFCNRMSYLLPFLFSSLQSPLGCMYNMMARTVCVGDHKASSCYFTYAI